MDEQDLISRLNECYNLADEGNTRLAQFEFEKCVKEFQERSFSYFDAIDKEYHKSRLDYCQELLDEDHTQLAKFEFENWFDEFKKGELEYNNKKSLENHEPILKIMEKAK